LSRIFAPHSDRELSQSETNLEMLLGLDHKKD